MSTEASLGRLTVALETWCWTIWPLLLYYTLTAIQSLWEFSIFLRLMTNLGLCLFRKHRVKAFNSAKNTWFYSENKFVSSTLILVYWLMVWLADKLQTYPNSTALKSSGLCCVRKLLYCTLMVENKQDVKDRTGRDKHSAWSSTCWWWYEVKLAPTCIICRRKVAWIEVDNKMKQKEIERWADRQAAFCLCLPWKGNKTIGRSEVKRLSGVNPRVCAGALILTPGGSLRPA